MAFGLKPSDVSEFAAKPFIQRALKNTFLPESVLSFYYGVDYKAEDADAQLKQGAYLQTMGPFWFAGHADYDTLCQSFGPTIQAIGNGDYPKDPWDTSVEGKMAQLLLCDQLSRNAFRGSEDAFKFDEKALEVARELRDTCIFGDDSTDVGLKGTFYTPYTFNLLTCFMHSESLEDHESGLKMYDYAKENSPKELQKQWEMQETFFLDHKKVVDQFGRYPHRNTNLGRTSTPEELAWLADTENLPGWAKSQG